MAPTRKVCRQKANKNRTTARKRASPTMNGGAVYSDMNPQPASRRKPAAEHVPAHPGETKEQRRERVERNRINSRRFRARKEHRIQQKADYRDELESQVERMREQVRQLRREREALEAEFHVTHLIGKLCVNVGKRQNANGENSFARSHFNNVYENETVDSKTRANRAALRSSLGQITRHHDQQQQQQQQQRHQQQQHQTNYAAPPSAASTSAVSIPSLRPANFSVQRVLPVQPRVVASVVTNTVADLTYQQQQEQQYVAQQQQLSVRAHPTRVGGATFVLAPTQLA